MAYTGGTFMLEVSVIDAGNNISTLHAQIDAADMAAALTIAAADINDFQNVTDAYVQSYAVREVFLNGATRTPAGNNRIKAVITVALETAPKKAIITVPAPKDTLFVGAPGTKKYDDVDVADSLVVALCGNFVSDLFISDGEHVTSASPSILDGKRASRSST